MIEDRLFRCILFSSFYVANNVSSTYFSLFVLLSMIYHFMSVYNDKNKDWYLQVYMIDRILITNVIVVIN